MDKPSEKIMPVVPPAPKRGPGRPRKPLVLDSNSGGKPDGRRASMQKNRLVSTHLTMKHVRNGKVYGPGVAKVPQGLASELLNTEYHARQVEEQFHGTKAALIVGRNPRTGSVRTIQVPSETFDDSFGSVKPFDTISGKGE